MSPAACHQGTLSSGHRDVVIEGAVHELEGGLIFFGVWEEVGIRMRAIVDLALITNRYKFSLD